MTIYDATEQAYKNGYEKGYMDAQCANSVICDNCVCMPVCEVYRATGGVARCKHRHEGSFYATKLSATEVIEVTLTKRCSRCDCYMLETDHVCPGCGAIMKGSE